MDMQINKTFLRQEREKRAWSQSHLAEVADLSMRTVQRIEHSGVASMESAKALAAALDVELAVLTAHSGLTEHSEQVIPLTSRRYRTWGGIGVLLAGLAALGWWSTAAAEQVMVNLSIETPGGQRSNMQLLNKIGEQGEVKLDNQLRVLISSSRQGEFLLLGTEIYDFVEGEYRLISSPSILVEDQKPASIYIASANGGQINLLFMADY